MKRRMDAHHKFDRHEGGRYERAAQLLASKRDACFDAARRAHDAQRPGDVCQWSRRGPLIVCDTANDPDASDGE
jgi:hypothetical protein